MCSLTDTKEGRQGKKAGGPGCRLGGRLGGSPGHRLGGVLDDVLWVNLVLLKDHKDRRVGHAVHTAVIEDVALALLGWGAEKGGTASGELAHQHPSQEHHGELRVGFAVVVGICGISGKVAPYKDMHRFSWIPRGQLQPGRRGSSVLSTRQCQWPLLLCH